MVNFNRFTRVQQQYAARASDKSKMLGPAKVREILVRDINNMDNAFRTYLSVEDVPEKDMLSCKILDAAQNNQGIASIERFGCRMEHLNRVYYVFCKSFRFVYLLPTAWRVEVRMTNEDLPDVFRSII